MFKIGDKIAHPMHGAGIISDIQEKTIDGVTRSYYVLRLPVGGMVVMIPTDTSESIGVRPIIGSERAEAVLNSISNIEAKVEPNWNKRYKENLMRIRSGDLFEVAKVIKCLYLREGDKGLSTGERKMLHSAKHILISEVVLSKNLSYEEVERKLNTVLTESFV